MGKMRFLWNNLADTATLTASSENPDFPLSNLKHSWYLRHHRTTGVTSEWWKWNLGSAQSISYFLFWYHNFQSSATIKLQANSSDLWTAPPLDISLTWNSGNLIHELSPAQSYQWWRLWVQDVGNPDGYLRAGRAYLGGYFEPSRNYSLDWSRERIDPSEINESEGGQEAVNTKTNYWIFHFPFPSIIDPDQETFKTISLAVKNSNPFFICYDSADKLNTTFYVKAINSWKIDHVFMNKLFKIDSIDLKEER